MYDLTVRVVSGVGFLPVTRDEKDVGYLPIIKTEKGQEVYRGEFQKTPQEALAKCMDFYPKVCD